MPTPDPTNEQFYQNLQDVDGRISCAQDELVRRLKVNMPDKIDFLNNEKLGNAAGHGIPKPAGYQAAPAVLDDQYINQVLVAISATTSDNGVRVFKNECRVDIYCVDRKIITPSQVKNELDRCGVIRGILQSFLTKTRDLEDRLVWKLLEPLGFQLRLPEDFGAGYAGSVCSYNLVQDDSTNNWI